MLINKAIAKYDYNCPCATTLAKKSFNLVCQPLPLARKWVVMDLSSLILIKSFISLDLGRSGFLIKLVRSTYSLALNTSCAGLKSFNSSSVKGKLSKSDKADFVIFASSLSVTKIWLAFNVGISFLLSFIGFTQTYNAALVISIDNITTYNRNSI